MKKIIYVVIVILLVLFAYKSGINSAFNNSTANQASEEKGLCTRTTKYNNPPELARALGLVSERWTTSSTSGNPATTTTPALKPKGLMTNCMHLIYKAHSEMDNAEGFFAFDKNSDPNDVRIYVDDTYKNYDDILTASLLKHEVIHAMLYYLTLEGNPEPTCLENEVSAFYSQLIFLVNLNPEEWKSITYRVALNPNLNSAYQITYYLLTLNKTGDDMCAQNPNENCWENYIKNSLRDWISSNPYYKKECNI